MGGTSGAHTTVGNCDTVSARVSIWPGSRSLSAQAPVFYPDLLGGGNSPAKILVSPPKMIYIDQP